MEPSNKVKAILYSNFTTESVQYGIESEPKAVDLFVSQMNKEGIAVKVEEVGLLIATNYKLTELKTLPWSKLIQNSDFC